MWIPDSIYKEIVKSMPIPCVDLLILNKRAELLLVKRKDEPAAGQWWFPGGRVLMGETREEAAIRKLKEECGLIHLSIDVFKTYDVLIDILSENRASHGITTVFIIHVGDETVCLDQHSSHFLWDVLDRWLHRGRVHSFVRKCIEEFRSIQDLS